MKEIVINCGDKKLTKSRLTTGDWYRLLDIAEGMLKAVEGKTSKTNADITNERIEFLAKAFNVSESELLETADFSDLMRAYHTLDLELTSAFLGTPLQKTAAGVVEASNQLKNQS